MAEHTPGPWVALGDWIIAKDKTEDGWLRVIVKGDDEYEPSSYCQGTEEDRRSNARLIASAPDILHALHVVLPMAKGYAAEHDVGANREQCLWAEEILRKAKEVS